MYLQKSKTIGKKTARERKKLWFKNIKTHVVAFFSTKKQI
jgi:hypothetical protein